MALRKLFVGGNWKSNNTVSETKALVENVINKLKFDTNRVEVVVAPIFLQVPWVLSNVQKGVQVAVQNSSLTGPGAYTGELAPQLVRDFGINWTILGHSERRSYYSETDTVVSGKTKYALDNGLSVILCIGETLEQRESGKTLDVVTTQLNAVKGKLKAEDWAKVVIAYEPVWAIGTGKTASPEQAEEVHHNIRNWLGNELSANHANATRVIYGGSVTDKNAVDLIKKQNIDGFLVGGASLKPAFTTIVDACKSKSL